MFFIVVIHCVVMSVRLDKFLCKSTAYTRNEAIAIIQQGRVWVNGVCINAESTQVHENNCITLDDVRLLMRPSRYLMLNKPKGYACSNVDGDYPSIMGLLDFERIDDLHIAGRLDVDTTGLVLITDDGRWSFNIIRPDMLCHKVYRVGLRDDPASPKAKVSFEELVEKFKAGIQLQGEVGLTQPAKLELVTEDDCSAQVDRQVLLTITEGKYHQVKRMFAAVGNRVVSLHRHSIGKIELDIKEGEYRYLSAEEVASV